MKETIELGKVHSIYKPIKVSETAVNKHILLTGMSGSGKTVALQKIEHNATKSGACVVVLNCGATHEWNRRDKSRVVHCVVRDEGFPFRLLAPIAIAKERCERIEDVSENVLEGMSKFERISRAQKKVLRQAIYSAIEQAGSVACMSTIKKNLEQEESEEAMDIIEKFSTNLWGIRWKDQPLKLGGERIFDIDFSGYDSLTQWLLAEMALSWLWRYAQLRGSDDNYDIYVVIDEFQNLNSNLDSILAQVLREGRRHKLFLLLATQTLAGVERCERVVLKQVGTSLFFKPTEEEYRQIARIINSEKVEEISSVLQKLRVGECIAKGRFCVGGLILEKPLKMSFR